MTDEKYTDESPIKKNPDETRRQHHSLNQSRRNGLSQHFSVSMQASFDKLPALNIVKKRDVLPSEQEETNAKIKGYA